MEDITNEEQIIEIMARVEHDRWSKWQSYLHGRCQRVLGNDNEITGYLISVEDFDWWESEIKTPYKDLTERQKDSDRNEAKKTISALEESGFEIV